MDFDGRGLGAGIAIGTVLGLVVMAVTGNPVFIGALAGLGAIAGMNLGWFDRDR